MRRMKIFWLFVLLLPLATKAQVNVVLTQPQPYQLKLEDFWKVTLQNNSGTTYNVYLLGKATSASLGTLVDARTPVFQLKPGFKVVSPRDISPITILNQNQAVADALKFTGNVPTGDYDICVSVINADNGLELGTDCIQHSVEIISGIELLLPEDKANIIAGPEKRFGDSGSIIPYRPMMSHSGLVQQHEDSIQADDRANNVAASFISFGWMPPSPAPRAGRITYSLTISEILVNQSPHNAIISNPAFYKVTNLVSTVYLYPFAARGFVSGSKYAWQVTAFLNGIKMNESEIYEFSYTDNNLPVLTQKPLTVTTNNSTSQLHKDVKEMQPSDYYEKESNPELNYANSLFPITSQWQSEFGYRGYNAYQMPAANPNGKRSPVQFNGYVKLLGETSNRNGLNSSLPPTYGNAEISPTLSLYGIPLGASVLLSTLGNHTMQTVSSYTFGLDQAKMDDLIQQKKDEAILAARSKTEEQVKEKTAQYRAAMETATKDKIEKEVNKRGEQYRSEIETTENAKMESAIKDREALVKEMIENGISEDAEKHLPGNLKFISSFKTLAIGTTYPDYSKNTISGVVVKGANIEWNPGILYLAAAAQKNLEPINNISYQRDMLAGRLGIGKIDKTHFILTAMHATDNAGSILVDSFHQGLTPKENWLLGADMKFSFFKNKLQFESEGVLSMLTRDQRDPEIISSDIPKEVRDVIKPKGSSSADYMYSFKGNWNNDRTYTKVFSEMKMLGPGFFTLGNPVLRNDLLCYEGRVDQQFFKRKVSIGYDYKMTRDNLLNTKIATTTCTSMIYKLALNFKKLPTLRIMVMPVSQTNDRQVTTTDSSRLENRTIIYNVTSTYAYKIGKIRAQSLALFSYNNSKTLFGLNNYWSRTVQLSEALFFKTPFSLTAGAGLVETGGSMPTQAVTIDVMPGYTFKKVVQLSGALNIAFEKDNSQKITYSVFSTILLGKYINMELRYEYAQLQDFRYTTSNRLENIFRVTLNGRW